MGKQVEIKAYFLNIRTGPGISNKSISTYKKGDKVEVSEFKNGWYKVKGTDNWISGHPKYTKVTDTGSEPVKNKTIEETKKDPPPKPEPPNPNPVIDMTNIYNSDYTGESVKRMRSIIGMPFQFNENTDRRIGGNYYGRSYAESIYGSAPIVHIVPGKPDFMSQYSLKQKESILNLSLDSKRSQDKATLESILDGKNGRYYDFKADYATRTIYLNALNSTQSIYLNIGNEYYPGTKTKLKDFNWHKQKIEGSNIGFFTKIFGIDPTISFFVNPDSNPDLSANNSTTKSKMEGLNSISDMANEMQFLTGISGADVDMISSENIDDHIVNINQKLINTDNPNSLMNRIKTGATVTIQGGKLSFPELWNDFTTGKSISIPLKFKSPYGHPKSIFLHVLEPLNEVLSIVFARQMTANAFTSPFLVRVYSKGWYTIDLGIIDSMSVTKGQHTTWSVNNLPTELDVTLNIKPLYERIALSRQDNPSDLLNNTALLDELATLAGVDLNSPSIKRKVNTYISNKVGSFVNGLDIFRSMPDALHGLKHSFGR